MLSEQQDESVEEYIRMNLDYVLSPAFFIVLSEHSILISCGKSRDMGNVPCSEHRVSNQLQETSEW